MTFNKEDVKKVQLNKITKEAIALYLKMWQYDGISFLGDSSETIMLSNIWDEVEQNVTSRDNILKVTDQNENSIDSSEENTYGIGQLLYELEVLADIPKEVLGKVSDESWQDFITRFINIYREKGWNVLFSKKMPLTDSLRACLSEENILSVDNVTGYNYEKYMILHNGDGGKISFIYDSYKDVKRIENRRLIVLFRAYIMELLCVHFGTELRKKEVELITVNWNWALNNPIYPKQDSTSMEIEKNSRYSVSNIVNNEHEYEDFLREIYGNKYSLNYVREIMDIPNRLKIETGSVEHENKYGQYLNVSQGERKTAHQPEEYKNTIYLLGGCVFFGYAVEDNDTIASYLQDCLNRQLPEHKWRVVNYGTWGGDIDWTYKRFYQINFKPGDIVLVSYAGYMPLGEQWKERDVSVFLKEVSTSNAFYYNGIVHCNCLGYEKVAQGIYNLFYKYFLEEPVQSESFYLENNYSQKKVYEQQVSEYVKEVQGQLPELNGKHIGAIVMNCNPFTLGHQYLIEYASKQVDVLIIFVVEENKSYFRFEDRIQLVKQGTKHLDNVYVVPSGKMIISTVTFPGYFLKDTPEAVGLDTSLDVSIFGEYIAKAFGITTRFVGEEPFDIVTRNYNESMKNILPKYGITLKVIPRKEMGESAISASRVRKLLEEKNFEEIKLLVPDTTYRFLIEHYQ